MVRNQRSFKIRLKSRHCQLITDSDMYCTNFKNISNRNQFLAHNLYIVLYLDLTAVMVKVIGVDCLVRVLQPGDGAQSRGLLANVREGNKPHLEGLCEPRDVLLRLEQDVVPYSQYSDEEGKE